MKAEARSNDRAEAVLEAATELLQEVGYASVTTDMVAARAHASKATIYRRWPTKIDLVVAVAMRLGPVSMPVPAGGALADKALREIVRTLRGLTVGTSGSLLLALHTGSREDSRIREVVETQLVVPQQQQVAAAVEALARSGTLIPDVDAGLAGRVICSLVIDRALAGGGPVDDDELDRIVDHWLLPALASQRCDSRTPGPPAGPG